MLRSMANRPIFIPSTNGDSLVQKHPVEFHWHAGFSPRQKQKSVAALHTAATAAELCARPLEISTKSKIDVGMQLSAFNLKFRTPEHRMVTVEAAYQSSKVFANGKRYKELINETSLNAKKDPRLRTSGDVVKFKFAAREWEIEPQTAFYDWLYMQALHQNQHLMEQLDDYDAFTDIEFNPQKSINCQAHAVALYRALAARGWLEDALNHPQDYLAILSEHTGAEDSKNLQQTIC